MALFGEERIVARGRAVRHVREDGVRRQLFRALLHVGLDGGYFGLGVLDLEGDLVQLHLGEVVLLPQEVDLGGDPVDLLE
jgi:hypothetical protein